MFREGDACLASLRNAQRNAFTSALVRSDLRTWQAGAHRLLRVSAMADSEHIRNRGSSLRHAATAQRRLLALLLLALACLLGSADGNWVQSAMSAAISRKAPQPPELNSVVTLIHGSVNEFRGAQGRAPLGPAPVLTVTAQYFADYMARTDQFSHTADGKSPADRARARGYDYCIVSENIAFQFSTAPYSAADLARQLVEGWKNSPPHRHSMLDADVTETGIAIAHNPDTGNFYAVQMFGRPAARSIRFDVVNDTPSPLRYALGNARYELPPAHTRSHTRCRPGQLSVQSTHGSAPQQTLRPRDGARYTARITSAGSLALVTH